MLYNIMLCCACMLEEETTKNTGKRVRGYSKSHATNRQPLHKPFHTKKADGVTRKSKNNVHFFVHVSVFFCINNIVIRPG